MLVIKNETGVAQTVAGAEFAIGEQRNIHEDLQPTDIYDAAVAPLNKTLAEALDAGDFTKISATPYAPPGGVGNIVIPATLQDVESLLSTVNFLGEVQNAGQLGGLNPDEGDYAGVQGTPPNPGTLWEYSSGAWANTGKLALFQNWIPPVTPPPAPQNEGQVTIDLTLSQNISLQASTGSVYRTGTSTASYNIAGFATVETISQAGDYFEFPSLLINAYQGYGVASA